MSVGSDLCSHWSASMGPGSSRIPGHRCLLYEHVMKDSFVKSGEERSEHLRVKWPLLFLLSHRSETAGSTQQLCVNGLDLELLCE